MANDGRISYIVDFKLDKTGLNEVKRTLIEIKNFTADQVLDLNPNLGNVQRAREALRAVNTDIRSIESVFKTAFDSTTGVTNISKLNQAFKSLNLRNISNNFNQLGPKGQQAFAAIANKAMTANLQFKETNNTLDRIGKTLGNTIRWSISSQAINKFTGAVQEAYGYIQHLDSALNDIRIVTGASADEMDKFAVKANEAAQALGASTTDYVEATLIYRQQGLDEKESAARAETTIKAANVTGQTGREVSEELTAVWNGYKVTAEETELYVDKLAAVAASTASDLEELSTGMSKVASAANNMGIDVDQLNGMLATVISVTRQAPETAGTAFKTIFARMEDLKISGEDEEGVKLGDVSGTLDEIGVHIIDAQGNMRDLGEVIEEVGTKWNGWTRAQQSAIAQAIAGKRQYNNLLALFDNWNMYMSAVQTSEGAIGTLQQQQDIYMESIAAHLQQLKTQWEELYTNLFSSDDINEILDSLTEVVDKISDLIKLIGNGKTVLLGLGSVALNVFNKQISQNLGDIITKFQNAKRNAESLKAELEITRQFAQNFGAQQGTTPSSKALQEIIELKQYTQQYYDVMTEEEIAETNRFVQQAGQMAIIKDKWEQMGVAAENYIKRLAAGQLGGVNNLFVSTGKGTNYNAVQNWNYFNSDAKTDELAQRSLQLSIDSANELQTAYTQAADSVRNFDQVMSDGNATDQQRNEAIDSMMNSLQNMEEVYEDFIWEANLDAETQDKLDQVYARLIERIGKLMDSYNDPSQRRYLQQRQHAVETALNREGEAVQEVTEEVIQLGQTYAEQMEEVRTKFANSTEILDQFKAKIHAATELDNRQMVQAGTDALRGITNISFGLQQLINLKQVWENEESSFGQKMLSTIIAISMGLPMVINGISALSRSYTTLATKIPQVVSSMVLQQQVEAGLITVQQADAISKEMNAGASLTEAAANNGVTVSFTQSVGAILKNTVATIKNTAAKAASHPILLAIVAVIGLITLAYKEYTDQLKENAEASADLAESQKEVIENSQAEKDSIDELASSYKTLLDAREENNAFTEEQKNEVYELVKAYGDQSLIIKALAGDYEGLEQSIRDAQIAASDKLKQDLLTGQSSSRSALKDAIIANAKESERDSQGFDLSEVYSSEIRFRKDLSELVGRDINIDESGHIGYDDLIDVLTTDSNKLHEFLDKYKHINATQQLRKILTDNSELIQDIKNYNDQVKSAQLDNLGQHIAVDVDQEIKDLGDFENKVYELTQEALKQGYVETYEEGEEWARSFLGGISDRLGQYEKSSYIANEILDTILPSEEAIEDRKEEIQQTLAELSKGGNVDLTNRPRMWNDDGTYSTVKTVGYGNEVTGYFNFTPMFLNPETGEYTELTQKELDDYVNDILTGKHDDYYNLQIGGVFNTADEADAAATKIHNLHEEYYTLIDDGEQIIDVADQVYEGLENLSDGQQAFIADKALVFKGLMKSGMQVSKIFENFSAELEAAESKDHIIKIDAVFNEGFDSKKIEEKIDNLFADGSFDIGMSVDVFKGLNKGSQAMILSQERQKEIEQIQNLTEAEKTEFEQRKTQIEELKKQEQEYITTLQTNVLETNQEYNDFIENQKTGLQDYQTIYNLSDSQFEAFQNDYVQTMEKVSDLYVECEENGNSFNKAIEEQWNEIADETVQRYIQDLYEMEGIDLATLTKQWVEQRKTLKSVSGALEEHQAALEAYEKDLEGIPETTIDWQAQLKDTEEAIKQVNATIDDLQDSYETLQNVVEQYNSQGYISLDNLQKIMTMDSSYVASLEMVNGQLQINNSTYDQAVETNKNYLKSLAAMQFLEEIEAIAKGNLVNVGQQFDASEDKNQQSIQDTIDMATKGVTALTNYAIAKAKASSDFAGTLDEKAVEQSAQAFYNKLQLIDTTFSQPTDKILTKEAKHEEYLEREVDLYRQINEQLEQIESTLGRIQKENSYKWGKDLQKGLERENKLLDQQLDKLKQKAEIQRNDIAQRRANLEAQGVQFSKDGSSMKNAEATLDKMYAQYNSMVDTYNAMSADQQEEYKKQLEAKKKDIDKTENDLKNYESLFGEYQSILDELQELHYKQIENAVERFNNMVDVHLELDDAKKEWNDFWYEVVQDVDDSDFGGKIAQSMSKLKTLVGLGAKAEKSQIGELTTHLNQTTEEVYKQIQSRKRGGEDSIFEEASKLSKENLEKYRDQLMDAVREAKEEVDSIGENYLKILDSAQDKIDKQVEGLDAITDHLEHNIDLIKTVSGENAYGPILKQYEQLYQNDLKLLNTQRQSKEFWAGQIERYRTLLASTEENTVQWKTYSEGLVTATDNYRKAVGDLEKQLQDTLKRLDEARTKRNEAIYETLDKALSAGKGLDVVEEEWKLINDLTSRYLDNVERAIEIELYSNDLEEAANAIGLSAENQAKLNKFRDEELKKLSEKNKLTQYDIDESRARLAILQAEMALEDQRANKSKMRLRRDSQGNYSYQYVGDEDAEDEAENGVLTAKKEWYELVKKRNKEVIDYNIELRKQYSEYIKQANEEDMNNNHEKAEELRALAEQVKTELMQNNEEINKNSQDLISGTAQFFADVEQASVLPTSSTTAAHLINDMATVGEAGKQAISDLQASQNQYVADTEAAIKEAGINYQELVEEGIDPTNDALLDLVDSQEELDEALDNVNSQLTTQENNLKACESAYLDLKDAAVEAISTANAALEELANTAIETQQEVAASVAAAQAAASAQPVTIPSGGTGDGSGESDQPIAKVYQQGESANNSQGKGNYYLTINGKRTGQAIRAEDQTDAVKKFNDDLKKKKINATAVSGYATYATGGYTGDWSTSDGKLAILHQKELVLNESDTSNLLKAITMLRNVVASINVGGLADSLVNSTAQWMNSMSAQSFGNNGISNISNVTNDTNNYKSMVVNADFSGVRSADAIYQALVELENYGMQQNYSTAPHASKSY